MPRSIKDQQKPPGQSEWKPFLDCYPNLVALRFRTQAAFAKACELLWSEDLRDLPFDTVGDRTVIIPEEVISYFESNGTKFSKIPVVSASEVEAEKLSKLRREQGLF